MNCKVKKLKINNINELREIYKNCLKYYKLSSNGRDSEFINKKYNHIQLNSLLKLLKKINLKQLEIKLNKGKNILEINKNDYRKKLSELRIQKELRYIDIKTVTVGTIANLGLHHSDNRMENIINYAKALGISKLIINIENEQD